MPRMCTRVPDLLHVAQDVLPAVKHSSALLAVQLVDEVSGEVVVAVFVSETQTAQKVFQRNKMCVLLWSC